MKRPRGGRVSALLSRRRVRRAARGFGTAVARRGAYHCHFDSCSLQIKLDSKNLP
jgi:hypothetical protein